MYSVARESVSASSTVQRPVPVVDTSIRYPVTGPPALMRGAVQSSSMADPPLALAVNRLGAFGRRLSVVALATLEASPAPPALIAKTL